MTDVCILTSSHSATDTRIYHKEARSLETAGYDISLVAHHETNESIDGIKIYAIDEAASHYDRFIHLPKMYNVAKSLDADVYHFHDPGLLPVGVALANRTDAYTIYDCHENYEIAFQYYDFPPDWANPLTRRVMPWLQSQFASKVDATVAATEWIADSFRERDHIPVETVRNFPKTSGISIRECPKEVDHEYILAYVGGLTEFRGLQKMVQLTDELLDRGFDVGLWLIGSADDCLLDGLMNATTNKTRLANHVELLGRIPYEQLFTYLASADLGLALLEPSVYNYGIPTKIFEYMYAELPVIASDTVANRKYLSESCGRIVPYRDTNEQASTVATLLTNKKQRIEMGTEGRELVEKRYSWENEKERLLNFYQNLLD